MAHSTSQQPQQATASNPQVQSGFVTRQSAGTIMPLDKQRFDSIYAQFCRSQDISPGSRVSIGDNGMVNLHHLHVYVMHEGGAASVSYLGTKLSED